MPFGAAGIELRCGARMQGDGGDPLAFRDAPGFEIGEKAVIDAEPRLDGDRNASGMLDRGSQNISKETSAKRQSGAAATLRVIFLTGQPKLRSM